MPKREADAITNGLLHDIHSNNVEGAASRSSNTACNGCNGNGNLRHLPRLELPGLAPAAFKMVSAKPRNKTVVGASDITVETRVVAIMKPKTSLRESEPVHFRSMLIKRRPHLVFCIITGRANTATMKNSGVAA